ncbi:NUDIX domain-containing protein [Rhodomicrobium vannielii ATCC 17100]|uniref:NUDIX domain-containing protein n=1 Tax=Rhodomicrobium vannielii TaxID=1069 RepID=UPI001917CC13|nr:NUDIX domain-containing protein [Rhodomicrobium vannielii]MBJ7534554.1 NUDIX domain-containing protein [Rhodomicrobium vannielii ATCC 17100]
MINAEAIERLRQEGERDGIQKIVVGAIIERDGKVLILRRSPKEFLAGLHEIPSGTVEPDEGLLAALSREVHEETGLAVIGVRRYVKAFDYLSGSGRRTRQFNFLVETDDGEIRLNPAEHDEAIWAIPETAEFAALNLSSETRACILRSPQCSL